MHEVGFTKLFSTIITSTIWQQDKATKVLWITMLALANRYGEVGAAEPGLAHAAGLTLDETLTALENLSQPDKFSRNKDFEGRRIAKIDGGWQILNYAKYRDKMRTRDAQYYRDYRATRRNRAQPCATSVTNCQPIAEAEAEAEANNISLPTPSYPTISYWDLFWQDYPKHQNERATKEQWLALGVTPELFGQIMAGLARWKASKQWQEPQYIPKPDKFLHNQQWCDQISEKEKKDSCDMSKVKYCYRCGTNILESSGRIGLVWIDKLPWCGIYCHDLWVKEGKPDYG